MWPFRDKPIPVTTEQLAAAVMEFMRSCGSQFAADLQSKAQEKWPLEPDEISIVGHEIFVASLWAASKALGPDRAVLDSLHDGYFKTCYHSGGTDEECAALANAAQSELAERYKQYYEASDKDMKSSSGRFALAFEMANCFFPKRKPVLDAEISFLIGMHTQVFMKHLLEARSKYKLKGV
jgi:hypothetical protein